VLATIGPVDIDVGHSDGERACVCILTDQLGTIKDWDLLHQRHFCVVFARLLCSAGITNEKKFHVSGSPTLFLKKAHAEEQRYNSSMVTWCIQ